MAPNTRRNGKSPMAAEQELLKQRLKNVADFMSRMSNMMETMAQNQSQPLLLTEYFLKELGKKKSTIFFNVTSLRYFEKNKCKEN